MAEQPNPRRRPATLNDLPDSLLIHILTLLPILSAIETSFISRQWRNLWHLMPSLLFIPDDEPLFSNVVEYDVRLANTITQVLFHRPKSNPLTSFRVDFLYNHRHSSFVTAWIRYALDCKVEDLCLFLEPSDQESVRRSEEEYSFPFHLYNISNRHVRCLRLCFCEIVMPSVDSLRFDSLRVLYLALVLVNDDTLTDLISRCVNLEELDMGGFSGPRNFEICSKSLKVLKLSDSLTFWWDEVDQVSSIEIRAPNLSKINLLDFFGANYSGDLSSVKLLKLKTWGRYKYFHKRWGNALNLFSNVEHAPALQTLVFYDAVPPKDDEEGFSDDVPPKDNEEGFSDEFNNLSIKPHIPSLREVKIVEFRNTMIEHWILRLFRKHGVALNKVVLVPANRGEPNAVLDPTSDDFLKALDGKED